MNSLLILVSIAQSVATALSQNPGNSAKVAEYAGYLNLATVLAARLTAGGADLEILDEQLKEAVTHGRGLTPEQRKGWRDRSDLANDVAREWLADHPESN